MNQRQCFLILFALATASLARVFAQVAPTDGAAVASQNRYWVNVPGTRYRIRVTEDAGTTKVEIVPAAQVVLPPTDPVAQPALDKLKQLPDQAQKVLGSLDIYTDSVPQKEMFEAARRQVMIASKDLKDAVGHNQPLDRVLNLYRIFDQRLTHAISLTATWEKTPMQVRDDLSALANLNQSVRWAFGLYAPVEINAMGVILAKGLAEALKALEIEAMATTSVDRMLVEKIGKAHNSALQLAQNLDLNVDGESVADEHAIFIASWLPVVEVLPTLVETKVSTHDRAELLRMLQNALETLIPMGHGPAQEQRLRMSAQRLDELARRLEAHVQQWKTEDNRITEVQAQASQFLQAVSEFTILVRDGSVNAPAFDALDQQWEKFVTVLGQLPPQSVAEIDPTVRAIVSRLANIESALGVKSNK